MRTSYSKEEQENSEYKKTGKGIEAIYDVLCRIKKREKETEKAMEEQALSEGK